MFPLVRAVNVSGGGVVPVNWIYLNWGQQNFIILIVVGLSVSERTSDRRT